ncbi:MAG: MarR family winged helix-turn-helix transcriptional regulator [Actinomycetota bacterium]
MAYKTSHGRTDQELVTRLRLAVMRLARRLRQQAEPGVTPSMLSALASIDYLGSVSLKELAELERVQPPTLTKIIARLEEAGLVRRDADSEDRRVSHVSLTPEGKQFIQRARTRKDAYLTRRLSKLGARDVDALAAAVDALERLLEEEE